MLKKYFINLVFLGCSLSFYSQTAEIPSDLRQHNLLRYNRSLLNPVFSYIDSENQQLTAWSRFQWTDLELPPTSVFVNYNRRIGEKNGVGLAAFQHDFSIFTANGLILNYARNFQLSRETNLTIGVNVTPIIRGIDRNNFTIEEFEMFSESETADVFIVGVSPGINLQVKNFNIGITSENLLDYNFSEPDAEDSFNGTIFLAHTSYDFNINSSYDILKDAKLRVGGYLKSIPDFRTQVGGSLLLNAEKGWIQAGYNNFYGPSFGIGVKLFDRLALGGLIELENDSSIDLGSTFEVLASWEFLSNKNKSKRRKSFGGPVPKKKRKIKTPKTPENLVVEPEVENITEEEFKAKNKKGQRYTILEESEDIKPGFYLVVNVYRTKKYFNAFMEKLSKDGLNPQYFFNKKKNYHYVYLKYSAILSEIEAARNSKFDGRYFDETWILWVRE